MPSWVTWWFAADRAPSGSRYLAVEARPDAGPVINTYLVGLRLPKHQHLGTSAWLYLTVNVSKIPFYVALGAWTDGGAFFTRDSLLFGLAMVPAIVLGVYSGRSLFHHLPQRAFLIGVLVLSAAGAVNLLL